MGANGSRTPITLPLPSGTVPGLREASEEEGVQRGPLTPSLGLCQDGGCF